jgi:hypothetical protein
VQQSNREGCRRGRREAPPAGGCAGEAGVLLDVGGLPAGPPAGRAARRRRIRCRGATPRPGSLGAPWPCIASSPPTPGRRSQADSQAVGRNRPARRNESGSDLGGRYWVRTSDLFGVKQTPVGGPEFELSVDQTAVGRMNPGLDTAVVTQLVTHRPAFADCARGWYSRAWQRYRVAGWCACRACLTLTLGEAAVSSVPVA